MTYTSNSQICQHYQSTLMFDYDHDEVYDGPGVCKETGMVCVVDMGEVCAVLADIMSTLHN